MNDFTISVYNKLLQEFKDRGYKFYTFEQYCMTNQHPDHFLILRHDVDRNPVNALNMAKIEKQLGIIASYYFRVVKNKNQAQIIKQIVQLGHEIGYHYEDLAIAKGNYEHAIKSFQLNLEFLRNYYPVKTASMHGSPLSKWDNKELWKKYNYTDFGILAEPYYTLNFNEIFYITDASRSWNDEKVTLRDKVSTNYHINIHSADDIIVLLKNNKLPARVMLSIHPHNWAFNFYQKTLIFLWQKIKNIAKKILVKIRE